MSATRLESIGLRTNISERPTEALAQFVADATYEDIPNEVVHEAKRMVLDVIGCALGGYVTDIGLMAVNLARRLGGSPQATVIGSGDKTSCLNAAHANARMANALDADDTFLCVTHHGAPTVASALAMCEYMNGSGKDLITAVAVGFDVGARLGISTGPPSFDPKTKDYGSGRTGGMPVTVFCSLAAAAKALGLSAEEIANAFGIAGVEANVGWVSQRRQAEMHTHKGGYSAATGITAALLAEDGMTADRAVLDGEFGIWRLTGAARCDFDLMTGQLGKKWYLLDTTYKPWPSCRWTHHPLTAFTKILEENSLRAEEIEKVVIRTHTVGLQPRFQNRRPLGIINCEFSHPYANAMVAFRIPPGPQWYVTKLMGDPEVERFMQKVTVELEPASLTASQWNKDGQLRKLPASVEVVARGRKYSAFTEYAKGDPWSDATYFTDEELKHKFRNMAAPVTIASEGWQRRVEKMIDMVYNLEKVEQLSELCRLLGGR